MVLMKEMCFLMECQSVITPGILMTPGLSASSLDLQVLWILRKDLTLEKLGICSVCGMYTALGMRVLWQIVLTQRMVHATTIAGQESSALLKSEVRKIFTMTNCKLITNRSKCDPSWWKWTS